jgi:hypothetical protein
MNCGRFGALNSVLRQNEKHEIEYDFGRGPNCDRTDHLNETFAVDEIAAVKALCITRVQLVSISRP